LIYLGFNITHINGELKLLSEKFGLNRLAAVRDLFTMPIKFADALTLKTWSKIWSTYALYDPSYANRESFGFFVDVGNGWTTLVPSLYFLFAITFHSFGNVPTGSVVDNLSPFMLPANFLGMMGLIKFYQEFYGTCIYFLSFFFNGRHKNKSVFEVVLFVGFSNGLWFFFPLLGMYISFYLIINNNFSVFH
jgi:hypothetical protein